MKTISKFKEKPKEKSSWWALWSALMVIGWLFLMPLTSLVILPALGLRVDNEPFQPAIGLSMVVVLAALIIFMDFINFRAIKRGERSWAVILGAVFATLFTLNAIIFVLGEILIPH